MSALSLSRGDSSFVGRCSAQSDIDRERSIALTNLCDGVDRYDYDDHTQSWHFALHYHIPVLHNIALPVLFVHDGQFILSGSDRGEVRIFDTRTAKIAQILYHPGTYSSHYT